MPPSCRVKSLSRLGWSWRQPPTAICDLKSSDLDFNSFVEYLVSPVFVIVWRLCRAKRLRTPWSAFRSRTSALLITWPKQATSKDSAPSSPRILIEKESMQSDGSLASTALLNIAQENGKATFWSLEVSWCLKVRLPVSVILQLWRIIVVHLAVNLPQHGVSGSVFKLNVGFLFSSVRRRSYFEI